MRSLLITLAVFSVSLLLTACSSALPTPISSSMSTTAHSPTAPRPATATPDADAPPIAARPSLTPARAQDATAAAQLTRIASHRVMLATQETWTPLAPTSVRLSLTAIVDAVMTASQPRIFESHLSPDGEWRAEIVIYDCVHVAGVDANAYEQLKIIRVGDGVERAMVDQLQYCGGLGAYGLGGLFWSPNSRYFYYTDARGGVPDGLACYWERSLIRVEVRGGNVERLAPGPLSPDQTMIAMQRDGELVLWSLDEGEIARASTVIPDAAVGSIAWSPDGRALVYLQTASECYPFGKSYVVRLDLPALQHTLLLESETPGFRNVIWEAPNRIRLFDENGQEWKYNFVTKALTPVP